MSDQQVRIGFIGAGGIARQRHIPNLKKIDGVELVAVANRSRDSSEKAAGDLGFTEAEDHWQSLVERTDIDAVFIGTWPYMHNELSNAALQAGKHVFCQARMALDWEDALAMHAGAKHHPQLVTMLCPPPHRMPWEPFIKRMISDGKLGELREVRVVSLNASAADESRVTWREMVEYSGLQMLQMGIWAETIHAWLGEYRYLSAELATPVRYKKDQEGGTMEMRIPQIAMITGQLTDGTPIVEHHSGVALHGATNHLQIQGSEGTLRVDAMEGISLGKPGEELEPADVPDDLLDDWHVEQDFIGAVRAAMAGEAWEVEPSYVDGLRYMRKVQAVHDSFNQRQAIEIEQAYPLPD
jgi:predicted dehydrogenase